MFTKDKDCCRCREAMLLLYVIHVGKSISFLPVICLTRSLAFGCLSRQRMMGRFEMLRAW